jgi:hypothetical protein
MQWTFRASHRGWPYYFCLCQLAQKLWRKNATNVEISTLLPAVPTNIPVTKLNRGG